MSEKSDPSWIHLFDDAIGLIIIVVALVAVMELAFSFAFALEVLSVGLLAMGVAWIVWSLYVIRTNNYARVFMFITGIVSITISVIDIILISVSPDLLIYYPALAMLLVGLSRLVLGILLDEVDLWIRMLQVLAGILTINLTAFVFILPDIGFSAMLILLVISLIANGLVRLIVGRTEIKQQLMQPTAA